MPKTLTNLLPPEREKALAREYGLRICVVISALITALIFSAAVLLIPTYVFLTGNEGAKEIQLANVESVQSPAADAALLTRLSTLTQNAAQLTALSQLPSPSTLVREILSVSRPGIMLSGFSYVPPDQGKPGTLAVSGSAKTREALRAYQLALDATPFVHTASLPVSAYAKDTDIAFTITLTLSL